MIKTIIFDLGQVIISFDWMPALTQVSRYTKKSVREIATYFTDPENDHLFIEGKIVGEEFYKRSCKALELTLTYEEFRAIYSDIFSPMPETDEIIKELEKNYTLAILSNTNEFHFPFILKHYCIMDYFEDFILSYEERCQKPQYQIYNNALERLHTSPQETIFIDDTEENVIAATQHGIRGIHFTGADSLITELRKYGVQV